MPPPPPPPPPYPLPPSTTLSPLTAHRLTSHTPTPYATILSRFRSLVPPIDLRALRAQTSPSGITSLIRATDTPSDFVLFAEFDHGRWIRYFPQDVSARTTEDEGGGGVELVAEQAVHHGRGLHRFIFGNPLTAITLIRADAEAGLHVPVECALVEQADGSTKMVMVLPGGLVAGHEEGEGQGNVELRRAVEGLEGKILRLLGEVMKG